MISAHVRAVAARLDDDRPAGLGVDAELLVEPPLGEQFLRPLELQLVGSDVGGSVSRSLAALNVGPVAPDADDDVRPRQLDRVDLASVDLVKRPSTST